jgi:hypothetical protein
MNQRQGDASQKAILEWVDMVVETPAPAKTAEAGKTTEAAN